MSLPRITIYTDGSICGNPGGPGGYAAILRKGGKSRRVVGFDPDTTNNRMELRAAIAGLTALDRPCEVELVTDSEYLCKGMREWLESWKRRGWKNSSGARVLNKDLWQVLDLLSKYHEITWTWIRGHTGDKWNEEADRLAKEALEKGLENA